MEPKIRTTIKRRHNKINIILCIYLITVGISAITLYKLISDIKAGLGNPTDNEIDIEKAKQDYTYPSGYLKGLFIIFCPVLNICLALIMTAYQKELCDAGIEEMQKYIKTKSEETKND